MRLNDVVLFVSWIYFLYMYTIIFISVKEQICQQWCEFWGILFAIPEHSFASTLRAVAKLQFARTRVITLRAHSVVVYAHQLYAYLWDTMVVIMLYTRIRHRVYCEQCQTMHLIFIYLLFIYFTPIKWGKLVSIKVQYNAYIRYNKSTI